MPGDALEVHLLGPPVALRAGRLLTPPRGRKSWAVLAMLALADRPVGRSALAQVLFADADDPLGALRWTLAELRRALGTPYAFRGDPVALDGVDLTVDALELDRGGASAARVAQQAGPLLEGCDLDGCPEFDTWLTVARHRLRSRAEGHLRDAAMQALALGDSDSAVHLAGIGVAANPYDESLQELLIRSLARAGDTAAARDQAQRAVRLLELPATPPALEQAAADVNRPSQPAVGDVVVASLLQAGLAALSAGAVDLGLEMLERCANQAGSPDLQGKALLALGTALVHSVRGKDEQAAVVLHHALLLAQTCGDRITTVNSLRELAFVDVQAGRSATVEARLSEALRLSAEDDGLAAGVLGVLGMHRSDRGDQLGALGILEESAELATGYGQPRQAAWSHGLAARSHLLNGEPGRAITSADLSVRGCQEQRWQAFLPFPMAMRAEARLSCLTARPDSVLLEIESDLHAAFALGCQLGDPCWEGAAARGLALGAQLRGDHRGALATIEDAYARTVRHPDSYVFIEAWVLQAAVRILRAAGDAATARVRSQQLQELALRTEQPWFLVDR